MKAVMKTKKGAGVELREIEKPKLGSLDILVQVKAASICGGDLHIFEGTPGYEWVPIPIILGHEFSGQIAEVGNKVDNFEEGDRVMINPLIPCGTCNFCKLGKVNLCQNAQFLGLHRDGGFAEYVVIPPNVAGLYKLPAEIDYQSAALAEPLCVVLNAVYVSNFRFGETALVVGPGPIGIIVTQLLNIAGAGSIFVAGLDKDTKRLTIAKEMGADKTINIQKEELISRIMELTHNEGVDVVFDATGAADAILSDIDIVKKGGRVVVIGMCSEISKVPFVKIVRKAIKIVGTYAYTHLTWRQAYDLLIANKINLRPLISHKLPLDEAKKGFQLLLQKKAIKVLLTEF